MPMGIVSDDDFIREKKNSSHLTTSNEIKSNVKIGTVINPNENKGRAPGDLNVPNSLRKIIGETAISGGRQDAVELAKTFGISESSASAYAVGARSTKTYDDRPAEPTIISAKQKIANLAKNKLRKALNQITDEKLAEAKLTDVSTVARQMSAIVRDMEPDESKQNQNTGLPQFVVYAPTIVREESYPTLTVKE